MIAAQIGPERIVLIDGLQPNMSEAGAATAASRKSNLVGCWHCTMSFPTAGKGRFARLVAARFNYRPRSFF